MANNPVAHDTGAETEADLSELVAADIQESVVFSTDWTTETLGLQLAKGSIDLDPAFQRRDAWTVTRKSKFIESIILGLPIPQIVLAEKKGMKGSFELSRWRGGCCSGGGLGGGWV